MCSAFTRDEPHKYNIIYSDSLFLLCREPRGFGFVQYVHPADAEEAKYHMDGQVFLGRELTVVFAEENRKKPQEMRARERVRFSFYFLTAYYLFFGDERTYSCTLWSYYLLLFCTL